MSNRIEDELFERVDREVPDLNGSFYPSSRQRRSEDDYPTVRYSRISLSDVDYAHSGPTDYTRARYQIDVYDQEFDTARDIANQIRLALDGWSPNGGDIHEVMLDNERSTFEEDTMEDKISADYFVAYEEPIFNG